MEGAERNGTGAQQTANLRVIVLLGRKEHRCQLRLGVGLVLTRQGGEVDGPRAQVPLRRGGGQVPRIAFVPLLCLELKNTE